MEEADTGEVTGLASRLRAARTRLGFSREELAVRSGVSWSAISQIESGRRRNVRPGTLSALADALDVTIDYLVDGSWRTPVMLDHKLLVYGSDDEFIASVGPSLLTGIERDEPTLLVTSDDNGALVRKFLGKRSRRVQLIRAKELYTNADATLVTYQRFVEDHLGGGAPWVRIVGEPLWAGRTRAQAARWCRYESLLNLVFAALPVTLVCPYDKRAVAPSIVRHARATHPETIERGEAATSLDYVQPGDFVLGEGGARPADR